jgi:hypothetical protein
MRVHIAEDIEQWILTINNELMATYLAKSAAIKVRGKLSLYEGRSFVVRFMKELIKDTLNLREKGERLLNQLNPLIAYTLGIVKHSMLTKEVSECNLT